MNILVMMLVAVSALLAGYFLYSRFLSKVLGLGSLTETPAHEKNDGVDYVPAKKVVLLGHHFASIAGAAPIIGPVLAAQYGWLPVFLWIILGGVFMGAVHDFTTLVASVRHGGLSVGTIIETYLGHTGKIIFLLFAWATLILVIAVFTKAVTHTFISHGAAATSSLLFILLALVFGFSIYRCKIPLWLGTIIGVTLLGACLYGGYLFPFPRLWSSSQGADPMVPFWFITLAVYISIASITPVNILLQPRDYLNSFLLYAMLGLSLSAIFVSPLKIASPAVTTYSIKGLGPIFPMLFVTVACGAISGFHSLVASGTTAKQLDKETDARPVAYGGMLIESLLAVIALISVIYLSHSDYLGRLFDQKGNANPLGAFSSGVAHLMTSIGIKEGFGRVFISLAVSAFALTSLDTATRLARFTLQELFAGSAKSIRSPHFFCKTMQNRYVATAITVAAAMALLFSGRGLDLIWQLFGSANQLLAALALMAVTIWLSKTGRKSWFTMVPMVIMYIVTITALILNLIKNLREGHIFITAIVVALLVLAFSLGVTYVTNRYRMSSH